MLVRYIVENFQSFSEPATLSLVSGRQRIHPNHKFNIGSPSNPFNILRSAVIYGANASGKSNLINSVDFAKGLILNGISAKSMIPVKRFKLSRQKVKEPSLFQFEIFVKGKMYNYGFKVTQDEIKEEWLYEILKNGKLVPVFDRQNDSFEFTINFKDKEEEQIFKFVSKGTRKNQLFLTESIDRNIQMFNYIYEWFQNLTIINPNSTFNGIEVRMHKGQKEFTDFLMDGLNKFDTGIEKLSLEIMDAKTEIIRLPQELIDDITNDKNLSNNSYLFVKNLDNERIVLHKNEQNELKALKLKTVHKAIDSNDEHMFDLNEESDGTRRILDLLPALLNLSTRNQVFLIDELDRSLHPELSKTFLQQFYNMAQDSKSQLIITTHETNLMDFNLIRKDEIWFVEKSKAGESTLYSLEEFQPRYDKDIQKGYLLGRFGALPFLKSL